MLWGYAEAVREGRGRCRDARAVAHVRRQQSARRFLRTFREATGSAQETKP